MKLLEREALAAELKSAALCNDLDRGTQILELGALGEIGYINRQLARRNHVEHSLDHING